MKKNENLKVLVEDNDSINFALKKFKRMCEAFGVVKEYRQRKEYRKPSVKLKEKTEAAIKRKRKESRRRPTKI